MHSSCRGNNNNNKKAGRGRNKNHAPSSKMVLVDGVLVPKTLAAAPSAAIPTITTTVAAAASSSAATTTTITAAAAPAPVDTTSTVTALVSTETTTTTTTTSSSSAPCPGAGGKKKGKKAKQTGMVTFGPNVVLSAEQRAVLVRGCGQAMAAAARPGYMEPGFEREVYRFKNLMALLHLDAAEQHAAALKPGFDIVVKPDETEIYASLRLDVAAAATLELFAPAEELALASYYDLAKSSRSAAAGLVATKLAPAPNIEALFYRCDADGREYGLARAFHVKAKVTNVFDQRTGLLLAKLFQEPKAKTSSMDAFGCGGFGFHRLFALREGKGAAKSAHCNLCNDALGAFVLQRLFAEAKAKAAAGDIDKDGRRYGLVRLFRLKEEKAAPKDLFEQRTGFLLAKLFKEQPATAALLVEAAQPFLISRLYAGAPKVRPAIFDGDASSLGRLTSTGSSSFEVAPYSIADESCAHIVSRLHAGAPKARGPAIVSDLGSLFDGEEEQAQQQGAELSAIEDETHLRKSSLTATASNGKAVPTVAGDLVCDDQEEVTETTKAGRITGKIKAFFSRLYQWGAACLEQTRMAMAGFAARVAAAVC